MKQKKHTLTVQECHSLASMRRETHEDLVTKLHKKHRISYKTLLYMKEYGPRSHVTSVIMKESIKILLLASMISAIGGIHIKSVQGQLVAFLPLLILLPALNDMIGDFGAVATSKFSTMLFLGKTKGAKWWSSEEVQELIFTMMFIAVISSLYIGSLSYLIAFTQGFPFTYVTFVKIISISLFATGALIALLMIIAVGGSFYIFKKKEDPNNFMIPITTSVADLGSLMIFTTLVQLVF